MTDHTQRNGLLLVLLAAAGYAGFPIFTRGILGSGQIGPTDLLALRFGFAVPVLWLGLRAMRIPAPERALPRPALIGAGLLFAFVAGTAILSLQYLPASTYTVVLYSYPAVVAVLGWFIGERLAWLGWLALVLTLVGVALTVPDFGSGLDGEKVRTGLLFVAANVSSYAIYILYTGRLLRGRTSSELAYASAWILTGALLAGGVVTLFQGLHVPQTAGGWVSVVGFAIFSTVIPIFAFNGGVQKLGAARASILSTIEPVFTLLLSFTVLHETLKEPLTQLLGAALILGSVILLQVGAVKFPQRSSLSNLLAQERKKESNK